MDFMLVCLSVSLGTTHTLECSHADHTHTHTHTRGWREGKKNLYVAVEVVMKDGRWHVAGSG